MCGKVQIMGNGPLLVNGEVDIVDAQGKAIPKKEECYLCGCGLSNHKPYCDGLHLVSS